MKIQYALFSSFIIKNQVTIDVLNRMSTIQGYVQGALRKKQLKTSFKKCIKRI